MDVNLAVSLPGYLAWMLAVHVTLQIVLVALRVSAHIHNHRSPGNQP